MAIPKQLLNFLDRLKVKYEVVEHRPVYTALDKAATLHLRPQGVVKTTLLKSGPRDYFLALIPAHRYLDKNKLKKLYNQKRQKENKPAAKSIDFVKEAWMKKNLVGEVGATPPLGPLFKTGKKEEFLPLFLDNSLLRENKLIVNAGDYTRSLALTKANFLKAAGQVLVKGSFSQAKK